MGLLNGVKEKCLGENRDVKKGKGMLRQETGCIGQRERGDFKDKKGYLLLIFTIARDTHVSTINWKKFKFIIKK